MAIAPDDPTKPAKPLTAAQSKEATDLAALFKTLGLPASLLDWAKSELIHGKSEQQIALDLQERPEFKAAFPEIEMQKKLGQTPMSAAQIVDYRSNAKALARQAGLPKSFYDQNSDFTKLIGAGVSFSEFTDRVKAAQVAAYQVPADVRQAFSSVLGIGDFTALAFDPNTAAPLLERKINEAEAITAASRTGFGNLSAKERSQIVDAGLSFEKQQQAFGELVQNRELFQSLDTGEQAITRQQQLGAEFSSDTQAQQAIGNRAARRKAQFAGSAGFGASQQGVSGLGQAAS